MKIRGTGINPNERNPNREIPHWVPRFSRMECARIGKTDATIERTNVFAAFALDA